MCAVLLFLGFLVKISTPLGLCHRLLALKSSCQCFSCVFMLMEIFLKAVHVWTGFLFQNKSRKSPLKKYHNSICGFSRSRVCENVQCMLLYTCYATDKNDTIIIYIMLYICSHAQCRETLIYVLSVFTATLFNSDHRPVFPFFRMNVCVWEGKTDVCDSRAFEGIVSILIIDAWFPIRSHQAENPSSHLLSFSSVWKRKTFSSSESKNNTKRHRNRLARQKKMEWVSRMKAWRRGKKLLDKHKKVSETILRLAGTSGLMLKWIQASVIKNKGCETMLKFMDFVIWLHWNVTKTNQKNDLQII